MSFTLGLLIAAVISAVICVSLFALLVMYKRRQPDLDDPSQQVLALKKKTMEFGIPYSELQFGKLLGKGSQGEVFRATWRGSEVAVKKIDTLQVSPEIIEEFCQEADIMRRLRHPSLTLFLGVSLEHPNLCIVTEIVSRGSLFDIIHDEHAPLTWPRCLNIALDVAKGMTYLHSHTPPILHRDLKSLNILVSEQWAGKVADMGMARFQDRENATMTQCGCVEENTPILLQDGNTTMTAGQLYQLYQYTPEQLPLLLNQDQKPQRIVAMASGVWPFLYRISAANTSSSPSSSSSSSSMDYLVTPNHDLVFHSRTGPNGTWKLLKMKADALALLSPEQFNALQLQPYNIYTSTHSMKSSSFSSSPTSSSIRLTRVPGPFRYIGMEVSDSRHNIVLGDGTVTGNSPLWMSPEMIKNDPYDEKSDVYSFGICLWELYTRKIPYRELGLNPSHLVVKVVKESLRPPVPKTMPRPYAKLMERCWHPSAVKRPTFKQILKVLETFVQDAAILNHKPNSIHASNVIVRPERIEEKFDEQKLDAAMVEAENAWKIDPNEVKLLGDQRSPKAALLAPLRPQSPAVHGPRGALDPYAKLLNELGEEKKEKKPSATSKSNAKSAAVAPAAAAANKDAASAAEFKSPEDADDDLQWLTAGGRPVSQGPGVNLGQFRGKMVGVRTCDIDIKLMQVNNEQKVQADLAGIRVDSQLATFMKTLSHIRHPNLVLFMGAFYQSAMLDGKISIVQEFMHRGNILDIINDLDSVFSWDTSIQFLIDAAQGLVYLHSVKPKPLYPDDLQTRNLLVDKNWRVKIADYAFTNLQAALTNGNMVVSLYSAPEILKMASVEKSKEKDKDKDKDKEKEKEKKEREKNITTTGPVIPQFTAPSSLKSAASNVYSFGVIIWQMMSRKLPFDSTHLTEELRAKIAIQDIRPTVSGSFGQELKGLIESCWHSDPLKRPTMNQVLITLQKLKEAGPPKLDLIPGKNAYYYRKRLTVFAYRSKDPVTIMKDWGQNVGKSGYYVIFSGEDDVYLCAPDVFHSTYEPVSNSVECNEFRKTGKILARCMGEAFAIKTAGGGGVEHGMAGDYLVQNEAGEQWAIEAKTFQDLYEKAENE